MLLVVLLLVDDDVPVDEEVVEQKELARFGFLPTSLGQHPLPNQHAT